MIPPIKWWIIPPFAWFFTIKHGFLQSIFPPIPWPRGPKSQPLGTVQVSVLAALTAASALKVASAASQRSTRSRAQLTCASTSSETSPESWDKEITWTRKVGKSMENPSKIHETSGSSRDFTMKNSSFTSKNESFLVIVRKVEFTSEKWKEIRRSPNLLRKSGDLAIKSGDKFFLQAQSGDLPIQNCEECGFHQATVWNQFRFHLEKKIQNCWRSSGFLQQTRGSSNAQNVSFSL